MNWLWTIAGIIMLMTGLIHSILGEKRIFNNLKTENLKTHYSGEVTKITLRWFWHFSSIMIASIGSIAFLMGCTEEFIPSEPFLAKILAGVTYGLVVLLVVVNLRDPSNLKYYPQGVVLLVIAFLIWIGLVYT